MNERIYVQTNDAAKNEVIAFDRSDDGRLEQLGSYETGGRGSGVPHLASQSSVVLSDDGNGLLVINAGSDELSLFGGEAGKAAASSYSLAEPGRLAPVSASVANTRSEVCWAATTGDGRFLYVTNFG